MCLRTIRQRIPANNIQTTRESLRAKRVPDGVEVRENVLQRWKCDVIGINSECVEIEMEDLDDQDQVTEFAEVYLSQFSQEQQELLRDGTAYGFIWNVKTSGSTYHLLKPRKMGRRKRLILKKRCKAICKRLGIK